MVPIPWVTAWVGTCARAAKKRALSCRVRSSRVISRVPPSSGEPGSLKPM